ncbi:MAG TPA: RDD family protein [Paracoccaceae bacterium]|nr:RDD family protein [Paracoccaceae bacterium]
MTAARHAALDAGAAILPRRRAMLHIDEGDGWRDGLPDPDRDPQFYEGVPLRRLAAWFIDLAIVAALTVAALLLLALPSLGFVFLASFALWGAVDFCYRALTLTKASATLGMQVMGIELRDLAGDRLPAGLAIAHTALYLFCCLFVLLQIASIAMMAGTRRGRSLPDAILGTTAINRPL